jgi:tRNA U34 5-methylaminomethyl-2-thiouridine-forming methyltransferase MnmC
MERYLVETGDGSHSLFVPALNERYHSSHGALQESRHVFIEAGLRARSLDLQSVHILEIGLGTGLNALLTAQFASEQGLQIHYTAIEAYPLLPKELEGLNYVQLIGGNAGALWSGIHGATWEAWARVMDEFQLRKCKGLIEEIEAEAAFDLIYFDAFAPEKQPELWTEEIFGRMLRSLRPGGMLVTYCAKGAVRRAMLAAGFQVERLQGPPGKREMLRARRSA